MNELFVSGETKRNTSSVFGDLFIEDKPTEVGSLAMAWDPKNLELEKAWKYSLSKYFSAPQTSPTSAVQKEITIPVELLIERRPFIQAELLDNEERRIRELILSNKMPVFAAVANRLLELFNQAKEEDLDSTGIALDSLRNFYNFLNINQDLLPPIICLTPENNIYALWRSQPNRSFSVHFLPTDEVQFAIFIPNNRHPARTTGISGTTTTDILRETIEKHGVISWISQ